MAYPPIFEQRVIEVEELYTFFHFHFATGYVFPGESHPFWEMVYVESGQVDIGADGETYMLGRGDVIFHRPGEFHSIWANYAHSPALIVMTFCCNSPAMAAFEHRQSRTTAAQRGLFASLLREAEQTFAEPLDAGWKSVNPDHPGGSYGMRLILTQLLMDMLKSEVRVPASAADREPDTATNAIIQDLIAYMRSHPRGELRFADLCRRAGMSATAVKQLFHRYFETTPMAYYEQLRMTEARRLLRLRGSSVASTAYALGFTSPGYFATRFRRVTGMTPREFMRDVPEQSW